MMEAQPFDPDRLKPDVRWVLKTVSDLGAPAMDSLTLSQMREAYRQACRSFGGASLEVKTSELSIEGASGPIPLRVYKPLDSSNNPDAACVYLHGGGWMIGDLETHDKICRRLVHASGHTVIAVDYRLAPEHPAPAGPNDVVTAIRWIHDHAEELAIDPARLAVAGDSAGGSLSAVATQQLRDEIPLKAQVLFYPSTDVATPWEDFPSRFENGNVPPLTLDLMTTMSETFIGSFDASDPRLSPLLAKDFHSLPPALIITAECDAIRDDGRRYREALEKAGNEVDYVEVEGMIHGFIELMGCLPDAVKAIDTAGVFLQKHLK